MLTSRFRFVFIALALCLIAGGAVTAQDKMNSDASGQTRQKKRADEAHTPAIGSAERKAIALALHQPCERELKQKIIVKFNQLRVAGDWAAAWIQPLQPSGKPIDYRKTKFKEQREEGAFDDGGEALLRRRKGKWTVLEWRFGNTDTEMAEWVKRHRAPAALVQ